MSLPKRVPGDVVASRSVTVLVIGDGSDSGAQSPINEYVWTLDDRASLEVDVWGFNAVGTLVASPG